MFKDWNTIEGCITPEGVPTLKCLPVVIGNVIAGLLVFSGTIAIFMLIFAGFKYVTSSGDPKQVEGAKQTMTYAIIGLVVILLSFFIINFISVVTGATCIQQFGFNTCK